MCLYFIVTYRLYWCTLPYLGSTFEVLHLGLGLGLGLELVREPVCPNDRYLLEMSCLGKYIHVGRQVQPVTYIRY